MKRFIFMIVVAAGSILLLSACGGGNAPAPTEAVSMTTAVTTPVTTPTPNGNSDAAGTNQAASSLPLDENGESIVARVNGQPISATAFERALARSVQTSSAADPDALAETVLDNLIQQAIFEQAAAEFNITVTEADIDADVAEMISLAGSPAGWESWKSTNLYTDEEYREAARIQILTFRVRDAVIAGAGGTPPAPTSATGTEAAPTTRQVRARHILVSTEAEAQDVLRRLEAGESFEVLAAALSKDVTTKDRGGDLGFFIRENLTTPELADAAFALQPNQIGPPVQTMLGYHVVQTLEFADAPASPEDAALQDEARFTAWLEARRGTAQVERYLN